MQILLNGAPRDVPDDSTLADLVESLDLGGRRFAIEVNEELVPRSSHAAQRLNADDRIEVVQAIGGG
jgi:sulfur carrier protein